MNWKKLVIEWLKDVLKAWVNKPDPEPDPHPGPMPEPEPEPTPKPTPEPEPEPEPENPPEPDILWVPGPRMIVGKIGWTHETARCLFKGKEQDTYGIYNDNRPAWKIEAGSGLVIFYSRSDGSEIGRYSV